MIEQVGNALVFLAFYTAAKLGKTGLTITCTVRKASDGSAVVTGQAAIEVGDGFYKYTLAPGSNTAEEMLVARFTTADTTVDQRDIPALWCIQKAGVENLDAAISSRPTAAAVADQVWDETAADHDAAGSMGQRANNVDVDVSTRLAAASYTAPPSDVTIATAVWDRLTAALSVANSIGKRLADNIDALISSRATNAAAADAVWDEAVADHVAVGSTGARLNLIGSATLIQVAAPVSAEGDVEIVAGDDYFDADARSLEWTEPSSGAWPVLTGATIKFTIQTLTVTGVVVTATGTKKVRAELTAAQTATLLAIVSPYDVQANLTNGHKVTLVLGQATVRPGFSA
jgi:hypothetical protein